MKLSPQIPQGIHTLHQNEQAEWRCSALQKKDIAFEPKNRICFKAVLQGEESYFFHRKHYRLKPGQALIVHEAQNYHAQITSSLLTKGICVDLSPDLLAQPGKDPLEARQAYLLEPGSGQHHIPSLPADFWTKLGLSGAHQMPGEEQTLRLVSALWKLDSLHVVQLHNLPIQNKSYKKEVFRRLCLAKEALHNFDGPCPDLHQLSHIAAISPWHLHRLFSRTFGCSPSEYHEKLKIQEACRRLLLGQRPVHVGLALGFADPSHFGKRFRKHMGTSPKAWQIAANNT